MNSTNTKAYWRWSKRAPTSMNCKATVIQDLRLNSFKIGKIEHTSNHQVEPGLSVAVAIRKEDKTPKRNIKNGLQPANNNELDKLVKSSETQEEVYSQTQAVYCYDEKEVWVPATIQTIEGDRLTLILSSNKQIVKCKRKEILLRSESNVSQVETLTSLTPLNEATVLCCLNSRYNNNHFYTSTGSTVIALNPFTAVDYLYTDHNIHTYHTLTQGNEPHIYEISERCYNNIIQDIGLINQSIIVSGESGAGKTVSAKHLLRYLTKVSNVRSANDKTKTGDIIQNKILDSNPILEAFGNAATPRNSNSSRFGKFIQLQFNRCGVIQGGAIQTYLLEKTRTISQNTGECNFHIFYQLLNEASNVPEWLTDLQSDIIDVIFKTVPYNTTVISEHGKLLETITAMTDIGMTQTQQTAVFQLLTSILYLGNIDFTPSDDDSTDMSSNLDNTRLSEKSYIDISVSLTAMDKAASLLGIEYSDDLEKVFLYRNIQSSKRRSVFIKPVSIVEAKTRRDCLAMLLYSRLFEWIVSFINNVIESQQFYSTIGLLDIYGFEIFETNSLEQLCINYANEKIQQLYVSHFMKDLQKEYELERIEWSNIQYTDNQHCLDVLEGTHSVFGLLNEEVYLNRKCNIKILTDRILDIGGNKQQAPVIKKPSKFSSDPGFVVHHYAGEVRYSVDQLVNKNKDNIPVELIRLLKTSTNDFIQELFSDYQLMDSPGKKKKTVLSKFKSSLDDLMSTLQQSDVHYIRCIKPNSNNLPGVFHRQYVIQQLRASGIIETVEICKQGYPSRVEYMEFLQRYGMLIPEGVQNKDPSSTDSSGLVTDYNFLDPLDALLKRQLDLPDAPKRTPTPKKTLRRRTGLSPGDHARKCCAAVLRNVFGLAEMAQFTKQFGKTKLFLKQEQLEKLESIRAEILTKHIIVLQWAIRRFLIKARWHRIFCARKIWKCWVNYRKRRRRKIRNIAASMIQRAFRNYNLQQKLTKLVKEKRESQLFETRKNINHSNCFSINNDNNKPGIGLSSLNSCSTPQQTRSIKIPGSVELSNYAYIVSPEKGYKKRLMETSLTDEESENEEPPVKRIKTVCKDFKNLKHLKVADGILTRRHLPKTDLRFHTRASVLKNAHIAPMVEVQCSLVDSLRTENGDTPATPPYKRTRTRMISTPLSRHPKLS